MKKLLTLSDIGRSKTPLLTKSLDNFNPVEFHNYVKALYERPTNTNESISVPDFSISVGNKIIIRSKRTTKTVTPKEIHLLANDYGLRPDELTELFKKRKWIVAGQKAS